MRYKIIKCDSFEYFEARVNEAIQQGWKPIGAVTVVPHSSRTGGSGIYMVCQAMIQEVYRE